MFNEIYDDLNGQSSAEIILLLGCILLLYWYYLIFIIIIYLIYLTRLILLKFQIFIMLLKDYLIDLLNYNFYFF